MNTQLHDSRGRVQRKFRIWTGYFFSFPFFFPFPFERVFPGLVYLSRDLDVVDLAPEETRFPDTLSL